MRGSGGTGRGVAPARALAPPSHPRWMSKLGAGQGGNKRKGGPISLQTLPGFLLASSLAWAVLRVHPLTWAGYYRWAKNESSSRDWAGLCSFFSFQ